jgi:hypothetical protein
LRLSGGSALQWNRPSGRADPVVDHAQLWITTRDRYGPVNGRLSGRRSPESDHMTSSVSDPAADPAHWSIRPIRQTRFIGESSPSVNQAYRSRRPSGESGTVAGQSQRWISAAVDLAQRWIRSKSGLAMYMTKIMHFGIREHCVLFFLPEAQ